GAAVPLNSRLQKATQRQLHATILRQVIRWKPSTPTAPRPSLPRQEKWARGLLKHGLFSTFKWFLGLKLNSEAKCLQMQFHNVLACVVVVISKPQHSRQPRISTPSRASFAKATIEAFGAGLIRCPKKETPYAESYARIAHCATCLRRHYTKDC